MNCRTVRMMAIAIGLCVATIAADSAYAAKDKAKHGVVVSITAPTEAKGTTAATPGSIKIKVTSKTDKEGTETSFDLADNVSVVLNGDPGKLSDISANDKITFKVTDGKVSVITKGRKPKKSQ